MIKLLPFYLSLIAIFLVCQLFDKNFLKNCYKTLQQILNIKHEQSNTFSINNNPHKNPHNSFLKIQDTSKIILEVYKFLIFKWYFDIIYNELINRPLLNFAYNTTFKSFDKGFLEILGPYGISKALYSCAFELKKMHIGQAYYYAYFMVLFLMINIITMHYILY